MNSVKAEIIAGKLIISRERIRKTKLDLQEIEITNIEPNKVINTEMTILSKKQKNKVLLLEKINEKDNFVIAVYTDEDFVYYMLADTTTIYQTLIKVQHKILHIKLTKRTLKFNILAYIVNPYNLCIKSQKFCITNDLYVGSHLKIYNKNMRKIKKLLGGNIYTFKYKIDDIVKDDSEINNNIDFVLNINDVDVPYRIGIKSKRIKKKNRKYYYAPLKAKFKNGFAIHVRRSLNGNLVLVKRLQTEGEKTWRYKLYENRVMSWIISKIGYIYKKIKRKQVNIYFEKFTAKAEEGTFELFMKAKQSKESKNYFIIDRNSKDYERIKNEKNVVKKYSFKYYWLIYTSDNVISTDSPMHVTELRSNNKYLRKCMYNKRGVFLQHGVTYMKCHGKNSPYIVGKEASPEYMIVGSEKEKDVVMDMLNLKEEQLIKTGLPIFSKIKYNHIDNKSEDIITIMTTWKPYEEYIYNFEETNYYKDIVEMCKILQKYVDKQQIIVIAHPKAYDLLSQTDLKNILWQEPISKALEKTKLLITDYSSVCYNSFYQGAGVVFYQPDLELYESENGALIPNDDEYIGKRVFNINDLEAVIKNAVKDKKIQLDQVRTKENEEIYKTINEFSDGKNIDRIYEELKKLKIL